MPSTTTILLLLLFFTTTACKKTPVSLKSFQQIDCPVDLNLNAVWFYDSLQGVVAGGRTWDGGFLLSTTDGGMHWQVDTTVARELNNIMFDHTGQAYTCGLDGQALQRPPGGKYWYPFRYDYSWYHGCFFYDGQAGVLVGGESYGSGYNVTMGPDAFWRLDTTTKYPNELAAVWATDRHTYHAVGYGWVMRSDDGGRNWLRLSPTDDFFCDIQFPTAQVGYICGKEGSLFKTTDSGQTWQCIRKKSRHAHFKALWFSSAESGWLVGENGLFWRTTDGGENWSPVAERTDNVQFTDVFAFADRGWLTAENGQLFYFEP